MTQKRTQLIVDARHPAVHIEVLDSGYALRASGYGRIEKNLPTGFYTVRYAAAEAAEEVDITLRPGEPLTLSKPPDLRFASAAPMALTSTSHENHQFHARRLSSATPLDRGRGAQLFVFIRDLAPGRLGPPSSGLSLHRMDGEPVLHFSEVAETASQAGEAPWAGKNIRLDPGTYRLRISLGSRESIEMTIVACAGWQSQVFLLRRGGTPGDDVEDLPDLSSATQFMVPQAMGFDPSTRVRIDYDGAWEAGDDLRLAELARDALAQGRRGIHAVDLKAILDGKWQDPLLGIFGLHLLLMRPDTDLDFASLILERLQGLIRNDFPHPDMSALRLEISRRRGKPDREAAIAAPPMLRRSWQMLVRATADQPDLIPPASIAAQISERLWGAGAWLIWETPQQEEASLTRSRDFLKQIKGWMGRNKAPEITVEDRYDRVIIGDVTLFKHGIDALPDDTDADAFSPVGNGLDETVSTESGQNGSTAKRRPPTAPSGDENFRRDVRSMVRRFAENPQAALTALAEMDFPVVHTAIEQLLPRLREWFDRLGMENLAEAADLDMTEITLLIQVEEAFRKQRFKNASSATDPISISNLVHRLGIPASTVQAKLTAMLLKLQTLMDR
jgi:hypothetical protein